MRLLGWTLCAAADDRAGDVPRLFDGREAGPAGEWTMLPHRERTAAVGVDSARVRAAMLGAGMGEALGTRVAVAELAVRLSRLRLAAGAMPRRRAAGPLTLDLFYRDARAGPRWLGLHPREFALLWRLADTPGVRIARETLLTDVWRLTHIPETNSLEVHVSRLRGKLAAVGAAWLVQTVAGGGYRLASGTGDAGCASWLDSDSGVPQGGADPIPTSRWSRPHVQPFPR